MLREEMTASSAVVRIGGMMVSRDFCRPSGTQYPVEAFTRGSRRYAPSPRANFGLPRRGKVGEAAARTFIRRSCAIWNA